MILASLATIIASQALISGAFSLTRQAMLLGFLPRVTIRHTAYESEGQIYIPEVNVLLGIGCLAIVLTFRESVKLAAAYGLAVTGTMLMTTVLFYLVIRHTWGWSRMASLSVLVLSLSFDLPFLVATLFTFFDGGYVPVLIGAGLLAGMLIWSRGRTMLMETYSDQHGLPFNLDAATFFIGHTTIVADRTQDWAFIPEAVFAYLERNAVREDQRYGLPADQVMEIGEQISI